MIVASPLCEKRTAGCFCGSVPDLASGAPLGLLILLFLLGVGRSSIPLGVSMARKGPVG
jgi:hypothetical protein